MTKVFVILILCPFFSYLHSAILVQRYGICKIRDSGQMLPCMSGLVCTDSGFCDTNDLINQQGQLKTDSSQTELASKKQSKLATTRGSLGETQPPYSQTSRTSDIKLKQSGEACSNSIELWWCEPPLICSKGICIEYSDEIIGDGEVITTEPSDIKFRIKGQYCSNFLEGWRCEPPLVCYSYTCAEPSDLLIQSYSSTVKLSNIKNMHKGENCSKSDENIRCAWPLICDKGICAHVTDAPIIPELITPVKENHLYGSEFDPAPAIPSESTEGVRTANCPNVHDLKRLMATVIERIDNLENLVLETPTPIRKEDTEMIEEYNEFSLREFKATINSRFEELESRLQLGIKDTTSEESISISVTENLLKKENAGQQSYTSKNTETISDLTTEMPMREAESVFFSSIEGTDETTALEIETIQSVNEATITSQKSLGLSEGCNLEEIAEILDQKDKTSEAEKFCYFNKRLNVFQAEIQEIRETAEAAATTNCNLCLKNGTGSSQGYIFEEVTEIWQSFEKKMLANINEHFQPRITTRITEVGTPSATIPQETILPTEAGAISTTLIARYGSCIISDPGQRCRPGLICTEVGICDEDKSPTQKSSEASSDVMTNSSIEVTTPSTCVNVDTFLDFSKHINHRIDILEKNLLEPYSSPITTTATGTSRIIIQPSTSNTETITAIGTAGDTKSPTEDSSGQQSASHSPSIDANTMKVPPIFLSTQGTAVQELSSATTTITENLQNYPTVLPILNEDKIIEKVKRLLEEQLREYETKIIHYFENRLDRIQLILEQIEADCIKLEND